MGLLSVLTLTEITDYALDRLQANVATDAPFTTAQINRQINDAYADIWDLTGTSVTKANHATLWTPSPAVSGTLLLTGVLANFKELLHVFLSTTVSSVGTTAGDVELTRMELPEILYRRNSTALYGNTVGYAVERPEAAAAADVGKTNLHLWPASSATQYFPAHYIKTKTDLSTGTDVPDVTELESRDIALIAAARLAPLSGRAELVPSLLADVSERTQVAMQAKFRALLEPKQKPQEVTT